MLTNMTKNRDSPASGTVASRIQALQEIQKRDKRVQELPKPPRVMTRLSNVFEQGVRVGPGRRSDGEFASPALRPSRDGVEGVRRDHQPPVGYSGRHGPGTLGCSPWEEISGFIQAPERPTTSLSRHLSYNANESGRGPRRHRSMEFMQSNVSKYQLQDFRGKLRSVQENFREIQDSSENHEQQETGLLEELETMIDDALEDQEIPRKRTFKGDGDTAATAATASRNSGPNSSAAGDMASHAFQTLDSAQQPKLPCRSSRLSRRASTKSLRRRSTTADSTMPRSSSESERCEYRKDTAGLMEEVRHATSPMKNKLKSIQDRAAIFEKGAIQAMDEYEDYCSRQQEHGDYHNHLQRSHFHDQKSAPFRRTASAKGDVETKASVMHIPVTRMWNRQVLCNPDTEIQHDLQEGSRCGCESGHWPSHECHKNSHGHNHRCSGSKNDSLRNEVPTHKHSESRDEEETRERDHEHWIHKSLRHHHGTPPRYEHEIEAQTGTSSEAGSENRLRESMGHPPCGMVSGFEHQAGSAREHGHEGRTHELGGCPRSILSHDSLEHDRTSQDYDERHARNMHGAGYDKDVHKPGGHVRGMAAQLESQKGSMPEHGHRNQRTSAEDEDQPVAIRETTAEEKAHDAFGQSSATSSHSGTQHERVKLLGDPHTPTKASSKFWPFRWSPFTHHKRSLCETESCERHSAGAGEKSHYHHHHRVPGQYSAGEGEGEDFCGECGLRIVHEDGQPCCCETGEFQVEGKGKAIKYCRDTAQIRPSTGTVQEHRQGSTNDVENGCSYACGHGYGHGQGASSKHSHQEHRHERPYEAGAWRRMSEDKEILRRDRDEEKARYHQHQLQHTTGSGRCHSDYVAEHGHHSQLLNDHGHHALEARRASVTPLPTPADCMLVESDRGDTDASAVDTLAVENELAVPAIATPPDTFTEEKPTLSTATGSESTIAEACQQEISPIRATDTPTPPTSAEKSKSASAITNLVEKVSGVRQQVCQPIREDVGIVTESQPSESMKKLEQTFEETLAARKEALRCASSGAECQGSMARTEASAPSDLGGRFQRADTTPTGKTMTSITHRRRTGIEDGSFAGRVSDLLKSAVVGGKVEAKSLEDQVGTVNEDEEFLQSPEGMSSHVFEQNLMNEASTPIAVGMWPESRSSGNSGIVDRTTTPKQNSFQHSRRLFEEAHAGVEKEGTAGEESTVAQDSGMANPASATRHAEAERETMAGQQLSMAASERKACSSARRQVREEEGPPLSTTTDTARTAITMLDEGGVERVISVRVHISISPDRGARRVLRVENAGVDEIGFDITDGEDKRVEISADVVERDR